MRVLQWRITDPHDGVTHECWQDDRRAWFVFIGSKGDLGHQSVVSYEAADRTEGRACTLAMIYNARRIRQLETGGVIC